MPRALFYYIHMVTAYAIVLFALATFWFDYKLKKLSPDSSQFLLLNSRFILFARITSYLALIAFLVGGYLGTPFFKVLFQTGTLGRTGWIYAKLILFIILLALIGAFGTKAGKLRREAIQDAQHRSGLLETAQRKMMIFKITQIIVVALLFYTGYTKSF